MKNIKTLLILLAVTAFSCDSNDDAVTPDPVDPTITQDGFTYHQDNTSPTFYETSNAYIEIDIDDNDAYPSVPDYYTFFFLNGRMYDNDTNINGTTDEVLLSVNTTQFVALSIEVSVNSSLNTGLPPSAGNTYIASANDSNVVIDLQVDSSIPQTFLNVGSSNIEFGEGNEQNSTVFQPASMGHSVTINAMNLDTVNPTNSTINVDYTFVNAAGELISGHYQGTLGVIED
ncbi:hypothetical protein [Bizionia myxarmorum]|uniref:DUF1735 domain-containing protein n=1 Tax=Bizionia myxarmorum TaxID=291186 RepID=A0A5D0RDP2_9FLAO|nr:hypothetical protein [Bizionia myxarmorum]TYB79717.1 hypothetical protein ES674_08195 [Bizionia myxarmorum]